MFHLNDQRELPQGRKCQGSSQGGSLGSGLVASDYAEQNRFRSVYLVPLKLCQCAAKCDSCWARARILVWKSKKTLPVSSTFSFPLIGRLLPLKELLDVSQIQAPDV